MCSRMSLISFCFSTAGGGESDQTYDDMEEVKSLLSSAARDCVPGDRNSFVSFQANTGVEVLLLFFSFFFTNLIESNLLYENINVCRCVRAF